MTYRLYYSPGACSMAVHVVLEEIGAPFALAEVSVARGENRQPEYLSINPKGYVPALAIAAQAKILTELPAILVYLAKQHPDSALLPVAGAIDEARVHEWLAWLAGWVHGVGYGGMWRPERFAADDASVHETIRANGRRVVRQAYAKIEETLADGRAYAVPTGYSIVDPFLLVLYRWGNRIGLPMREDYAAWTRLTQRLLERPAVQRVLEREGIAIE
ncbi:MAG TPA: glutathione S-transferase N-terminal domain-containing protein [Trinickia sp.]|nr:glutathione S-transferase N-terminal domain-containing protein [Trinickia sp.]